MLVRTPELEQLAAVLLIFRVPKGVTTIRFTQAKAMHESGASDHLHQRTPEEAFAFLTLLQNTLQIGLAVTDGQGRLIHLNRGLCALLSRPAEALLGRSLAEILDTPPEEPGTHERPGGAMASPATTPVPPSPPTTEERIILGPKGETRWVSVRHQPLATPHGHSLALHTFVDVTERKTLEHEQQQQLLRSWQEQKVTSQGVLASGIAHRFNNLLTTILGYADLARGLLPTQSTLEPMLHEVIQAAHRAADLTQQLLAFAGKGRFVLQPVHLTVVVRDLLPTLERHLPPKTSFQVELTPDLPWIEADVSQMRQVLTNLVANAAEAEGAGRILLRTGAQTLAQGVPAGDQSPATTGEQSEANDNGDSSTGARWSLTTELELPAGPYVFLEVEDNGQGIAPEIKDRIFEPFFTTKFQGRGLGLAAVLGIVRGHRGVIQVTSAPGSGTRFQVFFPAHKNLGVPEPTAGTRDEVTASRQSILVIEEDEGVAALVRMTLEGAGYPVLLAQNAQEGAELFGRRRSAILLVLLNFSLPARNGTLALAQCGPSPQAAKVVLMTGHNLADVRREYPGLAFAAVLQKPFTPTELLATVHQALATAAKG